MVKTFDVDRIRLDFPILQQTMHGHPLVYFDNAATTQKPGVVIEAVSAFYSHDNANVHRGIHELSARSTAMYEEARSTVARFLNANHARECIFVRGATEGINLVAESFIKPNLKPGDEILISAMEHHSNIVPWQMVVKQTGAVLKVAPISLGGKLLMHEFEHLLNERTKLVAITHVSNTLGTINPIKEMVKKAHAVGAKVLVDGAQAVAHLPVDVQDLDCDFYVFSGHKLFAPTGVGILWGRESLLNDMIPYQGGGDMITRVSFESTDYAPLPYKFEAGTPDISGAIGLKAAIDYLNGLDNLALFEHETRLIDELTQKIEQNTGFEAMATKVHKVPVLSLYHEVIHAHDVGTILDSEGIAVRSGHHCTMPLMDFYGVAATTRLSLSFYNTMDEVQRCVDALCKVEKVFG